MKVKFLTGLVALLAGVAYSQPAPFYQNDGLIQVPPAIAPQIDALNFVNNGQFIINLTNEFGGILGDTLGDHQFPTVLPPFEMQNTLTFSNFASSFMSFNSGFRFNTYDPSVARTRPASAFFNDGTINVGTLDTLRFFIDEGTAWFGTPLSRS